MHTTILFISILINQIIVNFAVLSAVSGIQQKANSLTEGMNIDSFKMPKVFMLRKSMSTKQLQSIS